jgi:hypothetical protein
MSLLVRQRPTLLLLWARLLLLLLWVWLLRLGVCLCHASVEFSQRQL